MPITEQIFFNNQEINFNDALDEEMSNIILFSEVRPPPQG